MSSVKTNPSYLNTMYERIDEIGQNTIEYIIEKGMEYQNIELNYTSEHRLRHFNSVIINYINKLEDIHNDIDDLFNIRYVWEFKIILSFIQFYSTNTGKLAYFSFDRISNEVNKVIEKYLKITVDKKYKDITSANKLYTYLLKFKFELEEK
jgi:hypothetical protein